MKTKRKTNFRAVRIFGLNIPKATKARKAILLATLI